MLLRISDRSLGSSMESEAEAGSWLPVFAIIQPRIRNWLLLMLIPATAPSLPL